MSKITRAGLSLVAAAAATLMIDALASTAEAQSSQLRLGTGPSAIPNFQRMIVPQPPRSAPTPSQIQPVQPAQPRVLRRGHYYGPGSAPRPNQFGPGPVAPAPLPLSAGRQIFGPSFNPPPCWSTGGGPRYTVWQGVTFTC